MEKDNKCILFLGLSQQGTAYEGEVKELGTKVSCCKQTFQSHFLACGFKIEDFLVRKKPLCSDIQTTYFKTLPINCYFNS